MDSCGERLDSLALSARLSAEGETYLLRWLRLFASCRSAYEFPFRLSRARSAAESAERWISGNRAHGPLRLRYAKLHFAQIALSTIEQLNGQHTWTFCTLARHAGAARLHN